MISRHNNKFYLGGSVKTENMKKKKSSKQKWQKPELTRVKLNPEQAVLSCCDSINKDNNIGSNQCNDVWGCTGSGGVWAPNS